MNKSIAYVGTFILGAAAGAIGAYVYLKKKFQMITYEEIESVKKAFAENYGSQSKNEESDEDPDSKYFEYPEETKNEYANTVNTNGYSSSPVEIRKTIYPIDPQFFGEIEDYEQVSLTYYSDGVLCDEDDNPIENIDQKVGNDFASHIGEYEDDSVMIQNDNLRCYFEIIEDVRKYTEVRKGGMSRFDEDED